MRKLKAYIAQALRLKSRSRGNKPSCAKTSCVSEDISDTLELPRKPIDLSAVASRDAAEEVSACEQACDPGLEIPREALRRIFELMDDVDRVNAACVCRLWRDEYAALEPAAGATMLPASDVVRARDLTGFSELLRQWGGTCYDESHRGSCPGAAARLRPIGRACLCLNDELNSLDGYFRNPDMDLDLTFASTLQFLPSALTALDFSASAVNACMDARGAKGLPWDVADAVRLPDLKELLLEIPTATENRAHDGEWSTSHALRLLQGGSTGSSCCASLRRLSIIRRTDYYRQDNSATYAFEHMSPTLPLFANLEKLQLEQLNDWVPLLKVMDSMPSLKTFASRWSYLELMDSSEVAALQRVLHRLETFDIADSTMEFNGESAGSPDSDRISFGGCKNMRELNLEGSRWRGITGRQQLELLLPPNLSFLAVRGCSLAHRRALRLPHFLKKVRLDDSSRLLLPLPPALGPEVYLHLKDGERLGGGGLLALAPALTGVAISAMSPALLEELRSAPLGHLTELELNSSALPGLGASPRAPLAGLPRLGFLESLRLVGSLDPGSLDLAPCASLRSLGIFGDPEGPDNQLPGCMQLPRSLTQLVLHHLHVCDGGVGRVLRALPRLSQLEMVGCTAPCAEELIPADATAVTTLRMIDCITPHGTGSSSSDDALRLINGSCAQLTKLTRVLWMDVAPPPSKHCDFWTAVATLKRLGTLRVLNTTGTRLT